MAQPIDAHGKPIYENDRVRALDGASTSSRSSIGIVTRIGARTGTLCVRFVGDSEDTLMAPDAVEVTP